MLVLNVDSKPLSGTPSRIPAYNLMMAQTDYLIPDDAMIYISDLESVFKSHWGKKSLGMGFIEEANPLKVFINLTMSFLKLAKNSLKNGGYSRKSGPLYPHNSRKDLLFHIVTLTISYSFYPKTK